jgi:hypothetical protein
MAMKKLKPKPFRTASAVKAAARAAIGSPPPAWAKASKKPASVDKHKATLRKLLEDSDDGPEVYHTDGHRDR